jgi:hypothetical protein
MAVALEMCLFSSEMGITEKGINNPILATIVRHDDDNYGSDLPSITPNPIFIDLVYNTRTRCLQTVFPRLA